MRRLFIFAAIVLVSCAGFCLAQDNDKADKYAFPPLPQELKQADSLLAAGDSAKGLAELRAIVNSKAGDEVRARAQYNIAYYFDKVVPKLIDKEISQIRENETTLQACVMRTRKELELKEANKSIVYAEYMKVVDNYKNSDLAPMALQWASFYTKSKNEQVILLQRLLNDYKDSPIRKEALQLIARVYADMNDYVNSNREWQKVIDNYPHDRWSCAEAMYNIAKHTEGAGQVKAYEKVINTYSDQEHWALMAFGGIAYYYRSNGNVEKAIEIDLKTVGKYPKHGSAPLRLQNIMYEYQNLGKWEESQKIKQRILSEYPESETAKEIRSWSQPKK